MSPARITPRIEKIKDLEISGAYEIRYLPAQLIRMSSLPNLSAMEDFRSNRAWSSVKSQEIAIAWDGNCLAITSIGAKSRPTRHTLAPLFKYQNARLRPMPLDAPVTSTTLCRK